MSGDITVYHGYRMRRRGDTFLVDYVRRLANPSLPRSFTWTDRASPADLEGFIDALLAGDTQWQRRFVARGLVQDLVYDDPPVVPFDAPPMRIRMGLDWLAAIIAGAEPCILPSHAWIELRTDRNGCSPTRLQAWRARQGLLPPARHPAEERYHRAHAEGAMLHIGAGFWLFRGWGVEIRDQQLICTRLVPRFPGDVQGFRWVGPGEDGRYSTLLAILTALNSGSRESARAAERQGWLMAVTRLDAAATSPWTAISPTRLSALQSGDDVLRIPAAGLMRTRRARREFIPVAWHISMVGAQLDAWHKAAVYFPRQRAVQDLLEEGQRIREKKREAEEWEMLRALVASMQPAIVPPLRLPSIRTL